MINKVLTEEEMFEERLRRLDKQEYLDEKEHNFILANIKACFRETIHQRDYIKQLESKIKEYENLMGTPIQDIMKRLKRLEKQDKILEILEPYTTLEYDYVNDEYNLIIDASERIPLSEDYDINRCSLSIDENEAMLVKEWLNE